MNHQPLGIEIGGESNHGRRRASGVVLAILAAAALVMAWNIYALPRGQAYDAVMHARSFRANASLNVIPPRPCAGIMVYNPPLYYYVVAKLRAVANVVSHSNIDTVRFARWLAWAMMLGLGWAACVYLLPRTGVPEDSRAVHWYALAFFLLPNQYLIQVMPRADHLLFLAFQLLVILWYAADFPGRLAQSRWRLAAWAGLLILMGHSRMTCVAGWIPFFIWGGWILWKHASASRPSGRMRQRLLCLGVLAVVASLSFSFYINRFIRTGNIAPGGKGATYEYYKALEKDLDKAAMFLNVDFKTMLAQPNRHARYGHGNNAVLPRLVNDMWADHWLYFSSTKRMGDGKVPWKRVVLAAAAPFTLLYFGAVLWCAAEGLLRFLRRARLSLAHLAAWIYGVAFLLLMLYISSIPEPGKNIAVKFSYLFAYNWLPFFCMAAVIRKVRFGLPVLTVYTFILFLLCLPLSIFW